LINVPIQCVHALLRRSGYAEASENMQMPCLPKSLREGKCEPKSNIVYQFNICHTFNQLPYVTTSDWLEANCIERGKEYENLRRQSQSDCKECGVSALCMMNQ